jgi:hypothetical protein
VGIRKNAEVGHNRVSARETANDTAATKTRTTNGHHRDSALAISLTNIRRGSDPR